MGIAARGRNINHHGIDYALLLRRNAPLKPPPGPIEVLVKIFPTLRRYILELILKGCDNDIVNAIECILATNHQSPSQHQNETPASRAQQVPIHYQVTKQQAMPPTDTMATISTFPNMDIFSRSRGLAHAQIYAPGYSSVATRCTFSSASQIPTLQFNRIRQTSASPETCCLKCSLGFSITYSFPKSC